MNVFVLFLICWYSLVGQAWETRNSTIYYDNNNSFHIKGLNWFGYETECNIVHGLWVNPIDYYFDIFHTLQVNALRIPFSYELIMNWDTKIPKSECLTANTWIQGMNVRETFHLLFKKAIEKNIVILLDFHHMDGEITDYLISDDIKMENIHDMWYKVINEFKGYKNLLGVDIKNEPHGDITWIDWGSYTSNVITYIKTMFNDYNGLFFLEGIEDQKNRSVWGGSFTDLKKQYISILPSNKIVFSPHVYGNSIRGDIAADDTYALFDLWFGTLRYRFPNNTIVIGEIGGLAVGMDFQWHLKIKRYLILRNIRNSFYWCLNPNSFDTGGILEYDWTTMNTDKVKFIEDLQPSPTIIDFTI